MAKLTEKQVEDLSQKLALESKSVWEEADQEARKEIFALADRYMEFLDKAKTERMAVQTIRELAEKNGFAPLDAKKNAKGYFAAYHEKVIFLFRPGKKPVSQGLRILGAHLDSPRLDLKGKPLYEDQDLAFLKTHYYGGIKKYHWLSRPLALHGVVCLENGETVEIHIGEDRDDPVFTVLDVLPHLSRNAQGKKKVADAFEAERMNILIGGLPLDAEKGKEKVKLAVLQLLHEKYGIKEEDFTSAELEAVPVGRARHVGLDRSLIGGYGHDDRCCAYAALEAIFAATEPELGSLVLLVDKEEIGSEGATGAQSLFLELFLAELLEKTGEKAEYLNVTKALTASRAISGDVSGGFDPDYPEVHEKRNAAFLGKGITLTKYTGSGGKYSASDANAEYVAWIRGVWNQAEVVWQAAGMGKIDEGGGGTIAKFLAKRGMEIVDAGPALLAMHAPFEIMHKSDLYSTYQAYKAFLEAKAK